MKATFELEAIELELRGGPVAGVDEAGRGPLAGPVVAASMAVVVFSLLNIAVGLSARSETRTLLNRDIISDSRQLKLYGVALVYGAALGGWGYLVAWGALRAAGATGAARPGGLAIGAVFGVVMAFEILRLERSG